MSEGEGMVLAVFVTNTQNVKEVVRSCLKIAENIDKVGKRSFKSDYEIRDWGGGVTRV